MTMVDGINTVDVTYNAVDMLAGMLRRWRRFLTIIVISFVLIALAGPLISWIDGWPLDEAMRWIDWPYVLGITLLVTVWIVAVVLGQLWVARWKKRDGSFRLTLRDEGLHLDSRLGDTLIYWRTFTDVGARGSRLFFLMEGNRGTIIAPARVFADRAAFDRWVAEARSRFLASKSPDA